MGSPRLPGPQAGEQHCRRTDYGPACLPEPAVACKSNILRFMASTGFHRHPPPLLARYGFGLMIDGIMRPIVRMMDKLGRADRIFRGFSQRAKKQISEKNPFKGYTPTEHDVFAAVYIKSGTNWTMQIVHQLLNHGLAEYDHIHSVVPWPDTKIMGPMKGYAVPLEDESIWRASPEQKRVIKTHLNWEDLPYSEKARYIFVIRDPKDVFVSSYYFFGNAFPLPSVDTWFKMFCEGNVMMFGSWAKNVAGYWAQRHRPNVLLLSFKQMKRDLPGTVRKISDFLGVSADEEILRRVR